MQRRLAKEKTLKKGLLLMPRNTSLPIITGWEKGVKMRGFKPLFSWTEKRRSNPMQKLQKHFKKKKYSKEKSGWNNEAQPSLLSSSVNQAEGIRLDWKGRDCSLFGSCNGSTCICKFENGPQSWFILQPKHGKQILRVGLIIINRYKEEQNLILKMIL